VPVSGLFPAIYRALGDVPQKAALQSLQKSCRFYVLIIWAKNRAEMKIPGTKNKKTERGEISGSDRKYSKREKTGVRNTEC
jgi:hypothetical protein